LLRIDEVTVLTAIAIDDVYLNRLATTLHPIVPTVERVLAHLGDMGAASAGLVDDPDRMLGHRLVVVHPREADVAGGPDDLPTVR
jgi:hypothetical protein